MSKPDTRTGLVIASADRLQNSVNGNPRWRVHFTDGTVAMTQSDASCNYDVQNRLSSSTELTPAPSGRCPNEYNHVPDIFTEQVTTGWGTLLTIYRDNQPVAYVSVYNTGEVLTETE